MSFGRQDRSSLRSRVARDLVLPRSPCNICGFKLSEMAIRQQMGPLHTNLHVVATASPSSSFLQASTLHLYTHSFGCIVRRQSRLDLTDMISEV